MNTSSICHLSPGKDGGGVSDWRRFGRISRSNAAPFHRRRQRHVRPELPRDDKMNDNSGLCFDASDPVHRDDGAPRKKCSRPIPTGIRARYQFQAVLTDKSAMRTTRLDVR